MVKSVNVFLSEELISEVHLFFYLFIQPIFLKDPDHMWEQDIPCVFKELHSEPAVYGLLDMI